MSTVREPPRVVVLTAEGTPPPGSEDALREALRAGRPGAATLDVLDPEPLPRDHPFSAMDDVRVSAHRCADVEGRRDGLAAQFEDDLRRGTAANRPVDQVHKDAGDVRSR